MVSLELAGWLTWKLAGQAANVRSATEDPGDFRSGRLQEVDRATTNFLKANSLINRTSFEIFPVESLVKRPRLFPHIPSAVQSRQEVGANVSKCSWKRWNAAASLTRRLRNTSTIARPSSRISFVTEALERFLPGGFRTICLKLGHILGRTWRMKRLQHRC